MNEHVALIDTHCHLNYDYSPKTDVDLVREAVLAGVSHLITVCADLPSVPMVREISERHSNVFHTIGVHPHEAITLKDEHLPMLETAARHPKCCAFGEIGLDYHYKHSPPEVQREALEKQLGLALKLKLPVIIHSREAEDDLLDVLSRYARAVPSGAVPGVLHCFSGTMDFGRKCLDMGFYIAFSGILTFKNADALRACARTFPLDRLLVETDSPYLAPVPMRGKRCEPSMVRHTALALAAARGVNLDEIACATTDNARVVFGIPR